MEETFRLEVFKDRMTEIPKRFLAYLGIGEGDEIRIVTNNGDVESVKGIRREENAPTRTDEDLLRRRREEVLEGKHDDANRLDEELQKPATNAAGK
jgi:bifunctional DNA-binding transcriptional regulator/antitoxin component of YhaV-PrlF toxin-antitoxin module